MHSLKIEILDRFRPVMTDSAFQLLKDLLNEAQHIDKSSDGYSCMFADAGEEYGAWNILAPLEEPTGDATQTQKKYYQIAINQRHKAPKQYQAFLEVCEGFVFGEVGDSTQVVLHDGFSGTLSTIGGSLFSGVGVDIHFNENIFSPIDIGLNAFYFFHPELKQMCFGDELVMIVKDTNDPIEIYLKELHSILIEHASHRSSWLEAAPQN
jgi:hypothetical protein